MKIAISSMGRDLNSEIDPRFGRCAFFIVVDIDNMNYEVFENQSGMLAGGAGIQSAQFIASKGVEAIITGNCGPNAMRTLETAGIKVITGCYGTVKDAVDDFKAGRLKPTAGPTVNEHFGMRGAGMGSMRGMRGMRGAGMTDMRGRSIGGGNELQQLKEEASVLRRQLERIEARIQQLSMTGQPAQSHIEGLLRIAVPVDKNMLSQHFGHAEQFLIADIEDGEIKNTEIKMPPPHEPGVLPQWLGDMGVNVIITGGMGRRALSLFDENGIRVIVGAPQMDPIEVIKEYLRGTLKTEENICHH